MTVMFPAAQRRGTRTNGRAILWHAIIRTLAARLKALRPIAERARLGLYGGEYAYCLYQRGRIEAEIRYWQRKLHRVAGYTLVTRNGVGRLVPPSRRYVPGTFPMYAQLMTLAGLR